MFACKSIRNLDFIKSKSRFPKRTHPLIIAFSPNLRLHLLRQLRLPLLHLLSVLLLATTAICYVVTRLRTGATNLAITLNCCTGNCYCYELKGSVIKSALIFNHVKFKSSIASCRPTLVFDEFWIIRDLQDFSNYIREPI